MNLAGKRILITGGAVRIGAAITRSLQKLGAEVVVHFRESEAEAKAITPFTIQADLSSPDCVDGFMERVNAEFGKVDVLINNAAVFHKDRLPDATQEKVVSEFQTNLFAPLQLIRNFAAQTDCGVVVNLLDRRINSNDETCLPYLLSKKALSELTKLAALELAPRIRVNAVAPGSILPPPKRPEIQVRDLAGKIPLERIPEPSEIADAVRFLIEAESVTGQTIFVDGGQNLLGNGV